MGPISSNQPNPQPITQSNSIQPTTNLRAQGKQFFTVNKCLSGINHLSGYQALLQQSQEAYQVLEFLEIFLTHNPTQPTKKLKISTQPNPALPNLWVDPTLGQLREHHRRSWPIFLPPKTSTYSSYQLRKRQHLYLLPTLQYSQFKNSYINRCLFKYV